ncbi:MAG: alanine--tRNA ligase [Neisseriaceae bacterium]|nr:MAG: alanine--tRNA ligase [Neisseriaceae bacterium]
MQVNQIRRKFLEFFQNKGHEIVKSSSLIPHDDPTLLFTNAGMNQFKDTFLGLEKRDYTRATTSQKCVRAGGKHNDLENVGYTARHHTFFEMLGNFSFGDYFKTDAIKYAWEFLTSPEWLNLPKDKLYVTVYHTDDEAFEIWNKEIGLAAERIIRIGDKASGGSDNFWQMGDTGPCGPCTEIFYDHGADIWGGLPGTPEEDGDRFIEIWNNVFMQFNRDESGKLHPLPKPSVDTGMGIERISAVLQHVHSNYEIDLFVKLIDKAAQITNTQDKTNASLKVLADHIRSVSFLIADGALPSNEGRGYVLRRIIRRAIRHGYKLGRREPFFNQLVAELVSEMGDAYPELILNQELIEKTIYQEEERFFQTIDNGMKLLLKELHKINPNINFVDELKEMWNKTGSSAILFMQPDGHLERKHKELIYWLENLFKSGLKHKTLQDTLNQIDISEISPDKILTGTRGFQSEEISNRPLPGDVAFKLYDTYGFPLDLTQDVCRECDVAVDIEGFDKGMAHQREMAKAAGKFKMTGALDYNGNETKFAGYDEASCEGQVTALYKDGQPVTQLLAGDDGVVVLDNSVFYAESGGQIGDVGTLSINGGVSCLFEVEDTQKVRAAVHGHSGKLTHGSLKVGDNVVATIDLHQRMATARNHSVTHLLHKALHEVIGSHATQKGSLVTAESTRFDFANDKALTASQIEEIERIVNHVIMQNYEVAIDEMSYDDAIKAGAMALFGEKYTGEVRVVKMGEFSTELCGGTHVIQTGDIGFFSIVSESGIANGVRRIEAITGEAALKRMQKNMAILDIARDQLKAQSNDILIEKINAVLADNKAQAKEISDLKAKLAAYQAEELLDQATTLANGAKLLILRMDNSESKAMVELTEKIKDKLGSGIVVIGAANGDRVNLVVGVTKDLTSQYKAGDLVGKLSAIVGGKGGGRPDLAQAGGSDISKLGDALSAVKTLVN